jgi:DegV family protein with EDD domain
VTNAAVDLPEKLLSKYNIAKIPHTVIIDNKNVKLDVDISTQDFYELLKSERIIPPTSNPEPIDFLEVFETSFEQSYDHIFCITAACAMGSATYSAAKIAARKYKDKITLIDCESASGVQGLMVLNIAELAEKGKSVEEIIQIIEDLKKENFLCGGFHTLDNIYKSGRLDSKFALYLTRFLKIKPIVKMENPGVLHSRFPALFLERFMINRIVQIPLKELNRDKEYDMIVSHVENQKSAEKITEEIKKKLKINRSYITYSAPIVGTHTGIGTILVSLLPSVEKEHAS